jgi:predicted Zn-dependent protease
MKSIYTILSAIFLIVPLALADGLPDLGDSSATVLSPLQEQKIADQIMKQVMSSDEVVSDPEITDYVQNLGYRLASHGPDPFQKFNFFVVKDNTINAFAMPGGVVGVHTGLILAAENESEVAGVLGHEIGHVVQHHLARMLAQQKVDSVLSMATMALALLAAVGNPQLGSGAMAAASAQSVQKQLDYTRAHEREADRVGLQIMTDAGFDPNGMPAFFEILQKGTRFVQGNAPSFLRTHPLTSERITDVRARVEQMGAYKTVQEGPDFYFVKAKLLAGLNSPSQAVDIFRNNLQEKKYGNEAAQHYGLAVALMRNRDWPAARKELEWLRANFPPYAMMATLAANLAVAEGNRALAAQEFSNGLAMFPDSRALVYAYAEYLFSLNKVEDVLKFVRDRQDSFPDDPYLYELMSKAYTLQGRELLRHQMQGEAYVRRYDIPRAVEQMDLAAKAADGDFYQHSIVEARLNQLRLLVDDPKKRN